MILSEVLLGLLVFMAFLQTTVLVDLDWNTRSSLNHTDEYLVET